MKKKILVIDDDRINVKLLQSRLQEKNFDVFTAFDGEEGLEVLVDAKPDLIILDVEMPVMNGYTFMTEMAKINEVNNIPVVVLTSHAEKQPIFQLRGVKGYLVKPVEFELLFDKIADIILREEVVVSDAIVVIESNSTQVKLITHFLGNAGFQNMVFSSTAKEGLEKVNELNPSVVVVSAAVEDADSLEICKQIKASNEKASVVILHQNEEDVNKELLDQSGADCYAVKSSNYNNLTDALRSVL